MLRFIGSFLILGLLVGGPLVFAGTTDEENAHEDFFENEYEDETEGLIDDLKPVRPDLVIGSLSAPYVVNGSFYVRVTVRNQGMGSASAFNLLFFDQANQHTSVRQVRGLARRMEAVLTFSISPPENQGPWSISAIADYGNKIVESNESNNVKHYSN